MSKLDFAGSRPRHILQPILLFLSVLAVYGVSLVNGFVWDDRIFFIGNPVYSEFNLRAIFFSLANGVEYLPLRDLTYAFDYLLWGNSPFGFHLTNLLFFTGNVLLVNSLAGLIIRRLALASGRTPSPLLPFVVAALFALHPLNAEAVNFITCRNVLVSGGFFFLACFGMIRCCENSSPAGAKWYGVSLFAFIGAMLGKATAIILPLLLLVTLPLLFAGRLKRIALLLAPFFAVAAGFYLLFKRIAIAAGFTDLKLFELTIQGVGRKIAVAVQLPFFYLGKLLFPHGFSVEYGTQFSDRLTAPRVLAATTALLLLAALIFYCRRRLPEVSIGLCWFIVAMIPVLNFFGTHPVVADRYAFLPAFGFLLATAAVIDRYFPARMKTVTVSALLLLLAGLAAVRSTEWRSNETLWKANIRNFPTNTKSYTNLADHYFENGEKQKALELLTTNSSVPWLNLYHDYFLGRYLLEQNDPLRAKEAFQKPLDVAAGFIGPLYFLGMIAEKEKDYVAAAQFYNRALASEEKDFFLQLPLVRERLQEVKRVWLDQHLFSLQQRLSVNPADIAARRDLALTLDRLGFYREALEHYLTLERGGVKAWQIYQNIANCYFNLNKSNEAITYYERVVALGGGMEETFNNLGIAYRKLEKYDKSIITLQQGVRQFPDSAYPAFNLAATYYANGQKELASNAFVAVNQKFPEFKDKTAPYLKALNY